MTHHRYDHRRENPPLVDNKIREVTPDLLERDEMRAEVMQVVRDALYRHGNLESLAKGIGRSPRCLYAIRCGYTRWPRWETLFALLEPLDLKMLIVPNDPRYH